MSDGRRRSSWTPGSMMDWDWRGTTGSTLAPRPRKLQYRGHSRALAKMAPQTRKTGRRTDMCHDTYPFEGNLFLFCNKQRRILKLIYWDANGFCMWLKRLEKDKFPWPAKASEASEITGEQFSFLLQGIDFWKAHKRLKYESVL
jgi:transposase